MLQKPIAVVIIGITSLVACSDPSAVATSTLISNAVIHDGSGSEAFPAAVSKREATPEEVAAMAKLVAADMAAGAIGLATGLEYAPGMYSSTEELIQLARIAAAVKDLAHQNCRPRAVRNCAIGRRCTGSGKNPGRRHIGGHLSV